jgi:natural product precursor
MKKLGKLSINPEKIINSKELFFLKGGSDDGTCGYYCWDSEGHDTSECDKSLEYVNGMVFDWQNYGWSCRYCCDHCYETPYCGY